MPRRRSARKRALGDWVYRGRLSEPGGTGDLNSGPSYEWAERSLLVGQANQASMVLYDSQQFMVQMTGPVANNASSIPMAARAADRRPIVTEVDGTIFYRPSNWAVGSLIHWGWRIIAAEQDPEDGAPEVDIDYTMFDGSPAGTSQEQLDSWANETRNLAEHRMWHSFSDNGQAFSTRVHWKGRWRLQTNHGLFVYMQALGGVSYTGPIFRAYLRTRVIDDTG